MMSFSRLGIPIFEQSPPCDRIATRERGVGHVLVCEDQFDVVERHAAQRREVEAVPADADDRSPLARASARVRRRSGRPTSTSSPARRPRSGTSCRPMWRRSAELPTLVAIAPVMKPIKLPFCAHRRRHEVGTVGADRRRIVRVGRSGEEERVLPRAEDEQLRDLSAQRLIGLGASDSSAR